MSSLDEESEEEFNDLWDTLQQEFPPSPTTDRSSDTSPLYHPAVAYVTKTWLPHKETFVSYLADQHMHLGSANTSRAGGSHAVIKQYIRSSTMDLLGVFKKLELMRTNLHVEIHNRILYERTHAPVNIVSLPIFNCLCNKVSFHAMELLFLQYKYAHQEMGACSNLFTRRWGLPCKHVIRRRIDLEEEIPISSIHGQ